MRVKNHGTPQQISVIPELGLISIDIYNVSKLLKPADLIKSILYHILQKYIKWFILVTEYIMAHLVKQ